MTVSGSTATGSIAPYYDRIERLVSDTLAGDRESLARLFDETAPRVLGLVSRIVGPGDVAHELTARVYESVWSHQEEAPCGAGLPWLVDLARRTAVTHKRSLVVPRQRGPQQEPPRRPFPPEREWMPALHADERQALNLVYLQGLTADEVDQRLGQRPGTTILTLREAMLHLAEVQNRPAVVTA